MTGERMRQDAAQKVIHMPRTPSAARPLAGAAARFIMRRERAGSRVGRMAPGVLLAALIVLLAWAGVAELLQASR